MFPIRNVLVPALITVAIAGVLSCGGGGQKMHYLDTGLTFDQRAEDLVSRMTLEEKISQMGHTSPPVERLGIPAYNWWNEALHGVARAGNATVFPQAIGLAAAWDEDLHFRLASAISDEGRAKHHESVRRGDRRIYTGLTFWSPNINIFRDPRWGRGMETYGEDPFLTSRLGVQFVRGMQGDDPKYLKTVATPKHYAVHSGPEPERHSFDAVVGQRDFLETYLPAFQATIVEGGAWSIMGAYNRFRGEACCASPTLLSDILRGDWGFQGYVVSDCWAIQDIYQGHKIVETRAEAAALAVRAGCDLNCGEAFQEALFEAVEKKLVSEAEIDRAVHRLFLARMKLGMFDPEEMVPYARTPYSVNESPEHGELALEAARKSIVLLKNEGGLLPLDRSRYKKVVVLGPQAVSFDCLLGNYHGHPSSYTTVLDGIREKLSAETQIIYRTGCAMAENFENYEVIPPQAFTQPSAEGSGLHAEYFGSPDLTGEPVATGNTQLFSFRQHSLPWPVVPEIQGKTFSARWTGRLTAPLDGRYGIQIDSPHKYALFIDGAQVLSSDGGKEQKAQSAEMEFAAASGHDLRLEISGVEGDAVLLLKWKLPVQDQDVDEVLKQADIVLLCLGLSPNLEGEEMPVEVPGFKGGDRMSIDLPASQEVLLAKAASSGKPVVLLLLNGSAVAINQADSQVPAIVEAWYPGQAGGKAVADVLFGDWNPAGRLPVTFYKSIDQLPPFEDYNMQGRTYRYFQDRPLYPFGHGLSYTTFAYADLELPAEIKGGDSVNVAVTVKNTGSRAGEEVVQLYLTDLEASVPSAVRSLVGFKRISLEPGESRKVEFSVAAQHFTIVNENGVRIAEPGVFELTAGGKQPGFSGTADASTTGTISGRLSLR